MKSRDSWDDLIISNVEPGPRALARFCPGAVAFVSAAMNVSWTGRWKGGKKVLPEFGRDLLESIIAVSESDVPGVMCLGLVSRSQVTL